MDDTVMEDSSVSENQPLGDAPEVMDGEGGTAVPHWPLHSPPSQATPLTSTCTHLLLLAPRSGGARAAGPWEPSPSSDSRAGSQQRHVHGEREGAGVIEWLWADRTPPEVEPWLTLPPFWPVWPATLACCPAAAVEH